MNDINALISQLQFNIFQNHKFRGPSYLNNEDLHAEDKKHSSPTNKYPRKRFENAFQMIVQAQIMMNPVWYNSVNNPAGIQMSVDQLKSNPMILTMVGIPPNETNDFIHFYKERLNENIIQNQEKRHELITEKGTNKKTLNTNAVKIGNFLINDALQSAGAAMYQPNDPQNSFMFPFNESNQFDDNEQTNDSDDQSNIPDEKEGDQNEILNHMKKQFFKNLANQHNLHENKTNNEHFIKQYENHTKKLSTKENTRENNEKSYNTMYDCCHYCNKDQYKQMPRKDSLHSTCNNCVQQNHKKICKCCVENCINHTLPGFSYCLIHKCAVHGCDCQKEPLSLYCTNHKCLLCSNSRYQKYHPSYC